MEAEERNEALDVASTLSDAIEYAEDALCRHDTCYGSYANVGKWRKQREEILNHIKALRVMLRNVRKNCND